MTPPTLLAVPNVSEGRDLATIEAIAAALRSAGARDGGEDRAPAAENAGVCLLDVHSDRDHHRSVFTLAGRPGALVDALLAGARVAVERIDVMSHAGAGPGQAGQHPHVGAVDVAPVVYLEHSARGAACAQALVLADRIGEELAVPVFLYGELTASDAGPAVTRAQLRRGGIAGLRERMGGADGLRPDFGPPQPHPRAGATLVAARPPLVAFNLQLAPPAGIGEARRIAALVREGGAEGLPGLRAIGVELEGGVGQVSMNVERPFDVPLAAVIEAVARHAQPASAELVGLAPRAAFEGFPAGLPLPGFDPARHVIENALGS
jgi:glutamate formiminotransferase / 5-formyltetrahydrofolate cyclo-ligase